MDGLGPRSHVMAHKGGSRAGRARASSSHDKDWARPGPDRTMCYRALRPRARARASSAFYTLGPARLYHQDQANRPWPQPAAVTDHPETLLCRHAGMQEVMEAVKSAGACCGKIVQYCYIRALHDGVEGYGCRARCYKSPGGHG